MGSIVFGYIKFTSEEWAQKTKEGEISFSCSGKFIADEQTTGDTSRGDRLEAVFAHIKKSDERIAKYKEILGTDLEVIEDNEYVYLRRRSSCLVPIYCIFGIYEELVEVKPIDEKSIRFSFDFPEKMYEGFSDESNYTCAFLQAKSFEDEIKSTFESLNIKYICKPVQYRQEEDEFFIEPTENREELFSKRSIYDGQNEYRIILPDIKLKCICERKNITLNPCNINDKHVLSGGRYGLTFTGKR